MVKPALLIGATRSRMARRIVLAAFCVATLAGLAVAAPLLAVPAMLAGAGTTTALAGSASSARPAVVGDWGYPLAGDYYFTGRGFGWNPVSGCSYCSKDHKGYDMSQECGVTIFAAGPGTVIRAGAWGTFGNAVQIDHGGGVTSIYGHMAWNSLLVEPGMAVVAGTPLGLEGTTGMSTGCHLHFEIRADGTRIDPESFMAARGLPLK